MHSHSLTDILEDDDLFDDYDSDEGDEDIESDSTSSDEEELDFEEFKQTINDQFKKMQKPDLFIINMLSQETYKIDLKDKTPDKTKKNTKIDLFETNSKNIIKKFNYGLFNEKNFYHHLIEESIKEEEQKQQKIMQKRLNEIQANLTKIHKSFKKIASLSKETERVYPQESYLQKYTEKQQKEFVDYILLEMAGINNKASEIYKNLSKLTYLTLLSQVNKFLRRHRLKHYKNFGDLQKDFIKYLYRRAFKIKKLPIYIFDDIFIPLPVSIVEQKPSEDKLPFDLAEEKPIVERSHGILDRINQILDRILSFLNYIFCCGQTTPQQEMRRLC